MTRRRDLVIDGCLAVFQQGTTSRGAIICAGHGYDALCTHRNVAVFADTLAQHGLSTLRFDYHGTGNSAGMDGDEDRIPVWLGNIAAAITFMRGVAGISEIVLIGYRLGGLLAAIAASRSPNVTRLVLIAPPASGRLYLREMQLQAQLYPVRQDEAAKDGGVSSAGFTLNAATAATLKAVKLDAIDQPHLQRALMMSSAIGLDSPVAAKLRADGVDVSCAPFDALADLSVDPIRSLAVLEPFADALPFLLDGLEGGAARPEAPLAPAHLVGDDWREEAYRFGPDSRLFGVLCAPIITSHPGRMVLFLNAGANRNIGWARLTVPLARRLAGLGYSSLRMDFSGLGESLVADPEKPVILYDDAFQADIAAALDWLAANGHRDIVVFGACSGAHAAFHAAANDARIKSLIMVNLLRFDISREEASKVGGAVSFRSTSNYLQRMRQLDGWKKLIAGGRSKATGLAKEYWRRGLILLRSRIGHAASRLPGGSKLATPVISGFAAIAARGGSTLIVYGDDDNGLDELAIHVGRHASLLRKTGSVEFALLTGADHNLTALSAQTQLTSLVERFLDGKR
ncbi:MAG: alpha/beta hydrolase [Beijerinckiaceae bacterium]|nr:alpha/beta hydrolase [Beijerinckiaceae bacterium]